MVMNVARQLERFLHYEQASTVKYINSAKRHLTNDSNCDVPTHTDGTDPECNTGAINPKLETALNGQIAAELDAFFAYLSMASYFGRSSVALPGCENYFLKMHREEHEHALMFMNYINMRGGKVVLNPITMPKQAEWTMKGAFDVALQMEIFIKQKINKVYEVAEEVDDATAMDIVTTEFLNDQDRSINELNRIITQCKIIGESGMGRYFFDKLINKTYVDKVWPRNLKDYKNTY